VRCLITLVPNLIQIDREAEDEIMRKARKHAAEEHNMKPEDITPEMQQKIRGFISGQLIGRDYLIDKQGISDIIVLEKVVITEQKT
jgi:predicted small metal-binding protein